MSLSLSLSLTIGNPLHGRGGWWATSAFDADYENNRYRFNGTSFTDETSFNTAAGIVKNGITRIAGPLQIGSDLFTNGNPVVDLTGWNAQNSALLSVVANELVVDANGGTNSTGYKGVATQTSHAYRYGATYRRGTSAQSATITCMTSGLTARQGLLNNSTTSDVSNAGTFGAEGTTTNIGLRSPNAGATGTIIGDGFFCYECLPFEGFTPAALAARIKFTTPASVASDQCLFDGFGNAQNRIFVILRASDSHLIVTVTYGNATAAQFDLGAVTLGASHTLEISNATNRFMARLDGGAVQGDTVGTMPGVAMVYIGRSNTGQTWTGTIERVTIWAGEHAPLNAVSMEGDSYSSVSGSGGVSGQAILATELGEPVFSTGVGGSTLAQQVARVQANPALYRGVFVHIDGDNNGYGTLETDMALYAAMIETIGHNRFIIVPQMQRANKTTEANAATLALSNGLLAAYPNNTIDGQAILAAHATSPGDDATVAAGQIPASLLQPDNTHLTSAGMGYLQDAVAALKTAKGW